MQSTDCSVQKSEPDEFIAAYRENAADQHFFDVLGSLWRAIDHENRCSGGHNVEHTDKGFLSHALHEATAAGEQEGTTRRKQQRVGIACSGRRRVSGDHGYRRSERRDLRKSEICKHDVAAQDLESEPGMNASKNDGCCERKRRK